MIANVVLNIVITIPWAMSGAAAPHAGLALATSLAAFINAGLLYRGLRRSGVYTPAPGWRPLFRQVLIANLALGGLLWLGAGNLNVWLERNAVHRGLWLALWVAVAMLVYFLVLLLSGFRLRHLRRVQVA